MKIDSLAVGPIGTNCYILQDEKEKVCAIIDPGDEAERIEKAVENTGCTPVMILLTHGHFDIAPLCGTCWRDGRTCRCIFTKATLPTGLPAALTCCFPGSQRKTSGTTGRAIA